MVTIMTDETRQWPERCINLDVICAKDTGTGSLRVLLAILNNERVALMLPHACVPAEKAVRWLSILFAKEFD
jgi:hypothetical protein